AARIANLLHSLGLGPDDVVLLVLPNVPQLYAALLGALRRATPCCINWMLKPAQLVELVRSTRAKAIVSLGPTPGYDIFDDVQAIRHDIDAHILTVAGPGGDVVPDSDLDALAAVQPERLAFRPAPPASGPAV